MRTTATLAYDVEAEFQRMRRERGLGMSEAINELVHRGGANPLIKPPAFRQETFDMQARIDMADIGEVLDLLDAGACTAPTVTSPVSPV